MEKLIGSGMDVARLNFSHGSQEEHRKRLDTVREVANRMGRAVACLQDLAGPKIRTGSVAGSRPIELAEGAFFTLTTEPIEGTAERMSTTYRELSKDVGPGNRILLDDGRIELEVVSVEGSEVRTRVITGGSLGSHKGINLPGVILSAPALTRKDRDDMEFGLEIEVDCVALSFVRRKENVEELREFLSEHGRRDLPIIAKIEKAEAVENLSSIVEAADGVMVARGDLGVEVAAEKVPMLQKRIIGQANQRGRLVITATQMLESMVEHPRPTRAEASDVANAILDGTDAVMLSAETAIGKYPVEALITMGRIAGYTETHWERDSKRRRTDYSLLEGTPVSRAVAMAACRAAEDLKARYVAAFTESGATARLVSHSRPVSPILAFTPYEPVYRRLALRWGVTPMHGHHFETTDEMIDEAMELLSQREMVQSGDVVVIVCGTTTLSGATNMIKIHHF